MTITPLGRLFVSERAPTSTVATRDGDALSFGRFSACVARVAGTIRAAGAARVAVLSADPYRFLVGLFGTMHAGATAMLLPDGLGATVEALRDEFDILLCDEPLSPRMPTLLIEDGTADPARLGELDPAAAKLHFFTSGSTGAAKLIIKSLAMLDCEVATLHGLWGGSLGRRPVLSTVPHRHIFGLAFHVLWPLASDRPFASHVDQIWEAVMARGTADAILVTSPAHLTRLSGIAPLPHDQILARVFTAGSPLHPACARDACQVLGVLPTEIFGSTETGAIATRTQYAGGEAWMPLPGISVRADDASCMIITSPYGPDSAPYVSADRIETTPEGGFHFLGRADRITKVEGKRVSLPRLEQELTTIPWVTDAAALVLAGSPDRLAAAVVLNAEGRAWLDRLGPFRFSRKLRRQLLQVLEPVWLPKSWVFVDELPRSAMGKRRDADVRALFTARHE